MRNQVQKALDFAVAKERQAEAFYKTWSGNAKDSGVQALFSELAAAERGHMEMLSRLAPEEILGKRHDDGEDLGLADLLVDIEPSPSMGIQEAMILAMKREATSVALYQRLAEFGGEAASLFQALAKEEQKHKDRLQAEYDEHILTEN